jgi:hypothetical protein
MDSSRALIFHPGNAILGYDTFKQVYPQADQEPFGGTRFRANDAIKAAGQLTSDFLANKTYVQSNKTAFVSAFGQGTTSNDVIDLTASFNYQHQLDVNNKAISSWDAAFGPQQANGDSFTTTIRYNFSDPISTSYTGFSVIGFDANKNETSTPQPFQAQDMVMVSHSHHWHLIRYLPLVATRWHVLVNMCYRLRAS